MRYIVRGIDAYAYTDRLKSQMHLIDDAQSQEEAWIDMQGNIEIHDSLRTVLMQEDPRTSLQNRIYIGYPGERCITIEGDDLFVRYVLKILDIPTHGFTKHFFPRNALAGQGAEIRMNFLA